MAAALVQTSKYFSSSGRQAGWAWATVCLYTNRQRGPKMRYMGGPKMRYRQPKTKRHRGPKVR